MIVDQGGGHVGMADLFLDLGDASLMNITSVA
jgi:hypothetical protein